jgi:hypothetical protein
MLEDEGGVERVLGLLDVAGHVPAARVTSTTCSAKSQLVWN